LGVCASPAWKVNRAGFLSFLLKRQLNKPLVKKLIIIFALGGLQGFLGWFMVKSGLINNPHVSHYRLAAHLITAFIAYGFTLWVALDLMHDRKPVQMTVLNGAKAIKTMSRLLLVLIILQVIYGAFVAGLKAGLVYNTFPKMGQDWIPDTIDNLKPDWINLFENIVTVQCIHRCIAWLIAFLAITLWIFSRKKEIPLPIQRIVSVTLAVIAAQFILGIFTLIYSVPVTLGVLHQLDALLVFTASIVLNHQISFLPVKGKPEVSLPE
jgi:heme a synthase